LHSSFRVLHPSRAVRARAAFAPLGGFIAALRFLTRLPVPDGRHELGSAFVWLPVVGLLLGVLLALADLVLRWLQTPDLLESTLLVVLLLALSGALHADGLMDTCDAVFVPASSERRMEIMRDPHVGAFGVVGLVSVIALKIAGLDGLPPANRLQLLWVAPTLGRWSILLVASAFPYGRVNGLGAPLKAASAPRALGLASVVPLLSCVLLGPLGLFSAAAAAVVALALGWWLCRLLPGLTGDCYGATCEVVETVVWVGGALMIARTTV
jgi:adenosylcobinamide-GDP ribazoletransferase